MAFEGAAGRDASEGATTLCAAMTVASYNQAQEGNRALWGTYQSTEGKRVLDSFNVATYPGERDPLKEAGIDAAKFGTVLAMG